MKSIINGITGEFLYCTAVAYELQENEIAINELLLVLYENPYYNFETKEFYNKNE
jgi:hypothetical protein